MLLVMIVISLISIAVFSDGEVERATVHRRGALVERPDSSTSTSATRPQT